MAADDAPEGKSAPGTILGAKVVVPATPRTDGFSAVHCEWLAHHDRRELNHLPEVHWDRCSPSDVVALLEAIRLIMDVPGMVFVLAMDYEVLVAAIQQKYPHASGDKFIEKIVQLPFRVPPLRLTEEHFFEELIPQWG